MFCAALLALCLYALAEPLVRSRPVRALAVFIAAQPALLFAYSLWSGIKELTAGALVALVCALVARRAFVAVAVAAAAILDVLGAAGVVWLIPAIVGLAFLSRRTPRRALLAVAVGLVLALPAWLTAGQFLRADNRGPFTSGNELGNLGRPLRYLQLFGIWPAKDFRVDPGHRPIAYLLIGLAIATAIFGLWLTVTRRGWGTVVYVAAAVVGIAVFAGAGSPWIAGKAYATATAAFALLAAIAIALAWEQGYRAASAIGAVLLAGGVLWSNVLAYHDVWLAPRGQLHELERIGDRFAGDGPALMTEYQPYGARHFLRKLDAEGAAELRVRPVFLRNGKTLDKSGFADLDQFALPSIFDYRTLVIRRSPAESMPPSPYRLVWRGSTYDVWQRPLDPPDVKSHLPLGSGIQPGGVPRCADVHALASSFPQARLVAVPRPAVVAARFPAGLYLSPEGATTVAGAVSTRSPGTYRAWIGGSFRGRLEIAVDGHGLGSKRHVLNNTGGWEGFGSLPLEPGQHEVTLRYSGSDLHPGSGGFLFVMGPVVLEPESATREISAPAAKAATLCGRHLDWVEAVGSR